jgi:hypothetical protein
VREGLGDVTSGSLNALMETVGYDDVDALDLFGQERQVLVAEV